MDQIILRLVYTKTSNKIICGNFKKKNSLTLNRDLEPLSPDTKLPDFNPGLE